jgi:succinyl-diaminopimelate desuccinylase
LASLSRLFLNHPVSNSHSGVTESSTAILLYTTSLKKLFKITKLLSDSIAHTIGVSLADRARILSLLEELIAANSENPPGHEQEVAKILRNHLESYGIACTSVGPSKRPNLIFSTHDGEIGPLVLHGHMDTVPIGPRKNWDYDPFGSEIVNDRLYGRGACDMKGPVSALAETMILYNEEKHEQPLLMLTTSDEESGCSGAERVAESGLLEGVQYGVCAEPTSLDVLIGEKGMLWTKVMARGKAAHGSRPDEGVNAINLCMRAIQVLIKQEYRYDEDSLLGKPTLNLGKISGGTKVNVVPEYCEAQIDMRLVKGQSPERILETMNARLETAHLSDTVKAEYMMGKPSILTPSDSLIVKIVKESVEKVTGHEVRLDTATYGTDCSVLQPKIGIFNVICGPGSIEQAHQPNEYISITQLLESIDVYLYIAKEYASNLE